MITPSIDIGAINFSSGVLSNAEFEIALEQRRLKKLQRLSAPIQAPLSATAEVARIKRLKVENEQMRQELARRAFGHSPAKLNYSEAGIDYIEAATTLIASMKKGLYT